MVLAAEAVDEPEDEAEEGAEDEAGDDGKGEGPPLAVQGDVSGEAAEGQLEAGEADDQQARDEQDGTGDDEEAA
jgi:hypothetical protein